MTTFSLAVTDEMFMQGQGFGEFDVHHKINDMLMTEVRKRLKGRDFNFVITVETRRNVSGRLREYEVTILE